MNAKWPIITVTEIMRTLSEQKYLRYEIFQDMLIFSLGTSNSVNGCQFDAILYCKDYRYEPQYQ